ncbi:MAG: hypothetical protein WC656_01300 [Sulfurimonas sp.]|jgi:hypothetical protein
MEILETLRVMIEDENKSSSEDLKLDPFIDILIDREKDYNGDLLNKKTSIATSMLSNGHNAEYMDPVYSEISIVYKEYLRDIQDKEKSYINVK